MTIAQVEDVLGKVERVEPTKDPLTGGTWMHWGKVELPMIGVRFNGDGLVDLHWWRGDARTNWEKLTDFLLRRNFLDEELSFRAS